MQKKKIRLKTSNYQVEKKTQHNTTAPNENATDSYISLCRRRDVSRHRHHPIPHLLITPTPTPPHPTPPFQTLPLGPS